MFKATRILINKRQPFSKYVVEKVCVRQIGGGMPNDCFNNAYSNIDIEKGVRIVSGWVVEPFNPLTNSTEIVQHWWNVDSRGNFFDTTLLSHNVEYVVDMALADFTTDSYDSIDSCVGSSLLLKDNCFYKVDVEGDNLCFSTISNLATENIYFEHGKNKFLIDRAMPYHSYLFEEHLKPSPQHAVSFHH